MTPNDFTYSDWNATPGHHDTTGGDPWAADGEPVSAWSESVPTSPAQIQPAAALIRPTAVRELLASEIVRYRGAGCTPADVAAFCQQWAPLHLIRNPMPGEAAEIAEAAQDSESESVPEAPQQLSPEASPAPTCLFGWYPPEVLAVASPKLMSSGMPEAAPADSPLEILRRESGQDNIVGVLSPLPHHELAEHLRCVIRGNDGLPGEQIPQQVLTFYTPSGVRSVLGMAQREVVAPLFEQVSAVIVEGTAPESWELFCSAGFDRILSEQFIPSAV